MGFRAAEDRYRERGGSDQEDGQNGLRDNRFSHK
jgi:hypothetical protein